MKNKVENVQFCGTDLIIYDTVDFRGCKNESKSVQTSPHEQT